jgi:hypothetical protein
MVKADGTDAVNVEQSEGDFIFGVGLNEDVVIDSPFNKGDLAALFSIGDLEEDRILLPLDFMLFRDESATKVYRVSEATVRHT